jgi:hypothetical protein
VTREGYDFSNTEAIPKPKFFIQESGRHLSAPGHVEVLQRAAGAEGAGDHRRRGSPVRRTHVGKSATRSRIS